MINLNAQACLNGTKPELTLAERLNLAHNAGITYFYNQPVVGQGPVLLCVEPLCVNPELDVYAAGIAARAVQNGQVLATCAVVSNTMLNQQPGLEPLAEGVTRVSGSAKQIFFTDFLLHLCYRLGCVFLPKHLQAGTHLDIGELVFQGHLLPLHAGHCRHFHYMVNEWDLNETGIPYDDLEDRLDLQNVPSLPWTSLPVSLRLHGYPPNLLNISTLQNRLRPAADNLLGRVQQLEALAVALQQQSPWLQSYRLTSPSS